MDKKYDGEIIAAQSYSGSDGYYFRIVHHQWRDNRFVQADARACDYVEHYGEDKATQNALKYDPSFNIMNNISLSRKAV